MWFHDCIYNPCSVKFTPCRNKLRPRLTATSVCMHTYTGSYTMPFKVGRLKTLRFMKGCFLQYSSGRFFLCWFINILQTASVPAHGGNIILFDYHCFCWFQISEFNVSGNPVFRDRSIQGGSVGPEIPLRPSLPNFTLVQEVSQRFTSM
jgi:hypothetical protein